MRTSTRSLLLGGLLCASAAHAQLQRIVVQGSGAPQVFSDITAAVAAAQNDDKLYLSGGTFIHTGALVIDKPLHFIGAGMHPDSTAVTGITALTTSSGDINITTAATGSSFTGLVLGAASGLVALGTNNSNDEPTGLMFERCRFAVGVLLGVAPGASSSTFNECIFSGVVDGNTNAATFTRCTFTYGEPTVSAINRVVPLVVDHCVFLGIRAIRDSGGALVGNSIFTGGSDAIIFQCSNATITNSLFSSTDAVVNSAGVVFDNNQIGVAANALFANETDNSFQFTDDLHMAAGSPGIGWADDGTDAGIYGSSTPSKSGAVPYNPHFRSATIGASTLDNGDLPVTIRVAAQTN